MYIKSLTINHFRAFQNKICIPLGQYMTAIAGMNGVGKSTILALLTNASQLNHRMLDHSMFVGDLADIIHYDPKSYDKNVNPLIIVKYSQNIYKNNNKLQFRSTVQNGNHKSNGKRGPKRYRLIPKQIQNHWPSSKKLRWPVAYLGLSRLYPVGEAKKVVPSHISVKFSNEIVRIHNNIMNDHINVSDSSFRNISLGNLGNKKAGTGIDTDLYSYLSNSSGQDDLGKIILDVLSFKVLKDTWPKYNGGIIAIDELDATLHPAAQRRLLTWLYNEARPLELQIVFTTHSFSLLHLMYKKINKKGTNKHDIRIDYLERDSSGKINLITHPSINQTFNDLNDKINHKKPTKVALIAEDNMSRLYIRDLFNYCNKRQFLKSRTNLIEPFNLDWKRITILANNIHDVIFIVDPDVSNKSNFSKFKSLLESKSKYNSSWGNIFILPGKTFIEEMLWNCISNIPSNDPLFIKNQTILDKGITRDRLRKEGEECGLYDKDKYIRSKHGRKTRSKTEKCKKWCELNNTVINYFMKRMILYNQYNYKKFVGILIKSIDRIYRYINDPFISK